MSTQKGNTTKTRAQKHQNKTKFKNDLHDNSRRTKFLNNLDVADVCVRCKNVIDWKIKYKKYKPLTAPATCVKCHNKCVKFAYHTICTECAQQAKVCPKCGEQKELVPPTRKVDIEDLLEHPKVQNAVKPLSERRRRTFYRQLRKPEISDEIKTEEDILEKLKELTVSGNLSTLSGDNFSDEFDSDEDEFDDD